MDDASKDNAVIIKHTDSVPLIIDPQGQAQKFLRRLETKLDEKHLVITKADKKFGITLENSVRNGNALMLQNVGETLEPLIDPILNKHYSVTGGRTFVNIGNNSV